MTTSRVVGGRHASRVSSSSDAVEHALKARTFTLGADCEWLKIELFFPSVL